MKYWIIVNSSKLTKVNALCFGLGKFETIVRGPIFNIAEDVSLLFLCC